MAKVWTVRYGGETYYFPAEQCKSADEAATKVGCRAGYNCSVTTKITPPDMTAEQWIAEQEAKATPTPTPTPTPPTPTTPTPTPTGPTPTTPTPAPTTTGGDAQLVKERLDQQVYDYNKARGTNYSVEEYLNALKNITQKTRDTLLQKYNEALEQKETPAGGEYTQQQQDDYDDYLAFLQTADGKNFPAPKDISDYLTNREQWIADFDYYARGYTEEQLREFNTWKRYASAYGDLTDWFPNNIDDWLANPDKAQKQLAIWQQEHGTALEEEEVSEAEQAEEDKYRQEQREKAAYYEQERYTEAPMYPETFTAWLNQQGQFSGALEKYVESQYPSLRSQFESQAGRLTGKPTREEARAEASRREAGFQAWLGGEVPGLKQEYWGQRPDVRGERFYMQSPNVRELRW